MQDIKVDEELAQKVFERLHTFHRHSIIKQAALAFIGSQLISKKDKNEVTSIFKKLDKNGNGSINKQELKEGFESICGRKISEKDLAHLMQTVDVDGTGTIEYTEFVTACVDRSALLSDDNLDLAFKMLDKDGSGSITKKDIASVFGEFNLHDRVVQELLKQADTNHDGKITKDEFICQMKKNTSDGA